MFAMKQEGAKKAEENRRAIEDESNKRIEQHEAEWHKRYSELEYSNQQLRVRFQYAGREDGRSGDEEINN